MHFTNREKLNTELGWENIQTRINFLGLSLFQKIHLYETRPLIRCCTSKLDYEKKYLTRSKTGYLPYPQYGQKFKNSFFRFITNLFKPKNINIFLKALNWKHLTDLN